MGEAMGPIELNHADYLPLVLAATIAVFLLYLFLARRRNRLLKLRSSKNTGRIFNTTRLALYGLALSLATLGIGLILLRPHVKLFTEYPVYEPLDIVIADDMSLSMLAQSGDNECGPSRLTVARQEEERFLRMLELNRADRVGLVVFARLGYRLIPVLTKDYANVRRVYTMADESFVMEILQGTNHWDAVVEATKIFDPRSKHKRVLVIVTDGEPDAPPEVLRTSRTEALKRLSELGEVAVYILGVGNPGVEYPVPKSRDLNGCPAEFIVQEEGLEIGRIITTRPSVSELNRLAREFGGTYHHSEKGTELSDMLRKVVEAERVQIGTERKEGSKDLTEYFIWAVLLLLVMAATLKNP